MAAKLYTCLKCGKSWASGKTGHPKQCKYCKRKDWDGLHNSYGRLLDGCVVPSAARVVAPVKVSGGVPCECILCGAKWVSRSVETVPLQCPKCRKRKWAAPDPFDPLGLLESGRCECRKCGTVWTSKVADGLPKNCPACKDDSWCQEVVNKAWRDRANPVKLDCEVKWFMMSIGPGGSLALYGDPVTGVHQYFDNPKGLCSFCGWNNHTHQQVGVNHPTPITAEEGERRKRQWELEHPGEKF